MKYLVVSTRYNETNLEPFENFTICAETKDKKLAVELMNFYNRTDIHQHSEVHPVLDSDTEIYNFPLKYKKI